MAIVKVLNPIKNYSFILTLDTSGDDASFIVKSYTKTKIMVIDELDSKFTLDVLGKFSYKENIKGKNFIDFYGGEVDGSFTSLTYKYNNKAILSFTSLNNIDVSLYLQMPESEQIAYLLAGADIITGGAYNDIIFGYGGNDKISGANGNDIINGGPGNDIIDGGAGLDTISTGTGEDIITTGTGDGSKYTLGAGDKVIISFGNTKTTIMDFNTNQDKIDLSEFGIDRIDVSMAGYGYSGWPDVINVSQVGSNAKITPVTGTAFEIILIGVSAASINSNDFS